MRKMTRPKVDVERIAQPRKRAVKLLMDLRPEAQKHLGPGPSKTMYRLTRIWKKMWIRRAATVVLPGVLAVFVGWKLVSSPALHAFMADQRDWVIEKLATRPEFAVHGFQISGASGDLTRKLSEIVEVPEGASTMTFDVAALQADISAVPAVRQAAVSLGPKGYLQIVIDERVPEALWRDHNGDLWLMDREGVAIDPASTRAGWPHLPVILGETAPDSVGEALALFNAFPDLQPRLRALVRVGARRWNIELDKGLTILLPEVAPRDALARVMAWEYGDEMLQRGLVAVDMRLPERPTLRMNDKAHEILRLRKAVSDGAGEET